MNARDSTLYPSLAARNEYVRFLLGMSEWMRGRGNGEKEGRRTEEGTGELLVMAGERETERRPRQQDEGGNQFRPSSKGEKGCLLIPKLGPSRTDWTQRSVGRGPSCACPPPRSLGRLVIEFALQHATHPGSSKKLRPIQFRALG